MICVIDYRYNNITADTPEFYIQFLSKTFALSINLSLTTDYNANNMK